MPDTNEPIEETPVVDDTPPVEPGTDDEFPTFDLKPKTEYAVTVGDEEVVIKAPAKGGYTPKDRREYDALVLLGATRKE